MTNLLSRDRVATYVYQSRVGYRWRVSLLGSITAGLALGVYLATLAPDLSWQHSSYDGGELITAAVTLGVPHPPGYPTYVLLGKLISFIPLGPVAFRFNLFSAVCVATAAGLLAATASRLFFIQGNDSGLKSNAKNGISSVAAGLSFAYTPLVWSQAVITEVYGLNLALLAGFLWALLARRSYRLAGFLLGLSITSHLTSLFFLPLAIGLTPRAGWRTLAGWLMVGLTPLAAIPLLARSGSPVVWGQPGDLQGWWWIASGQLYRNNFRFPLEPQHVTQVFRVLSQQVAWLCLPLILGALKHSAALQNRFIVDLESNRHLVRSDGFSRPDPTQAVRPLVAMTIGLYTAYSLLYHTADASVFLLPAILLLAMLITPALRLPGIGAFVLPVTLLLFNFQTLNASRDHQVRPLAESILAAAPENAILLTPGDRSIFSLWYFHHVEDQRPDVILVDSNLFAFSWYRQRLEELYPDLHGLAADNLLRFRETNQQRRPVCQVNLVDNESGPAGIRCDEK